MTRVKRKNQRQTPGELSASQQTAEADALSLPETTSREELLADHQLAMRCVAGEVKAWEDLHAQCHDRLVATVRVLLSPRSNDVNLADEIAARVWYALIENDGELLTRYDPKHEARLITFMRAIARDMICRHYRSEGRRFARERRSSTNKPDYHSADVDQAEVSLDEFLDTLTPAEREFCGEYLLNSRDDLAEPSKLLSRTNLWQKTHRVYRQFVRFFEARD